MGIFQNMYEAFETLLEKARVKTDELTEKFRGWSKDFKENDNSLSGGLKDYGASLGINGKTIYLNSNKNEEKTEGVLSEPLLETLLSMENDYQGKTSGVDLTPPELPESLGLKEKEYVPLSEKELENEALKELMPGYEDNVREEEMRFEKKENALNKQREDAENKETEEKKALNESYQTASQNHRDKMIFQGLTNSTINESGQKELEDALELKSKEIEAKYDRKYIEIENSLKEAERELSSALELYDLNLAADLQERIEKLKAKEEKRLEEINDYNLTIREKELEYQIARANKLNKLREDRQKELFDEMRYNRILEEEQGVSLEKRMEYQRRGELAKEFYSQFSKEQASALINEVGDELHSLLGTEEFFNLHLWNARR